MLLRVAILGLSLGYGVILVLGAGILTGGGHCAMVLAPLFNGPLSYVPAHFSSAFHNPDSPLIIYAGAADTSLSLLAVLSWPVAAGFAIWRAKWCFRILMGLYYISIAGSWIYMWIDWPQDLFDITSGWHLTLVLLYALVFIGGQVALWALHRGRWLPSAQPSAPPNGGPAALVGSSGAVGGRHR